MANYLINDTQLTSVADAIRAKSGGSAGLAFPSGFISEIGNISSGGGGAASSGNDVVFYDDLMNDCRGGIAYSYSAAEFAKLTEMPANPDHSNFVTHGISIPMTSQGWNWSLADAKAYVAKHGKLNIGQTYIPTDGKSHWICYVPEDAPVERWNTEIQLNVKDGSVNWQVDDGTISTASGNISVTFPSVGWHDVKISAPNGVTYYPYYSLSNKTYDILGKIRKTIQVFLGSGVSYVGSNAFYSYSSLTSITISNGVTSIGDSAFYDCCGLTSVTIPDDVTKFSNSAFYQCYSLTSITIPNGVTSIGSYVFYNCYSLTSVTIPDSVTNINNSNIFYHCYSLASISIPDGITSIGSGVFQNCSNLMTIAIPVGVTNISSSAFSGCSSLTSISIPDSVTSINSSAFESCFSLTSIIIPDEVTSIGSYVFSGCFSLKNIIMESSTPPTLSNTNAFVNLLSDYSIIVPAGSRESYIAATNWSSLADHIVEATA